ncbi:MAG: DUF86 domain-containing protein [Cyanothece sp. SIO1E1]|nr:DUF86 domain-containing protein [Cyanothece sp. SIO1E1]
MAINIGAIRKKLDCMLDYLKELRLLSTVSHKEFSEDVFKRRMGERVLQLIIEVALDINRHLLKEIDAIPSEPTERMSNEKTFHQMRYCGILSTELTEKLVKAGSFRNHLVHNYESIDLLIVHSAIQPVLKYFPLYVEEISDYLSRLE